MSWSGTGAIVMCLESQIFNPKAMLAPKKQLHSIFPVVGLVLFEMHSRDLTQSSVKIIF